MRDNNLKVVLTGEGSDEFLGGYDILKRRPAPLLGSRPGLQRSRPLLLRKLYGDVKGISDTSQAYLEAFFRNGLTETDEPALQPPGALAQHRPHQALFSAGTRAQLTGYDGKDDLDEALCRIEDSWSALARAQFVEVGHSCRSTPFLAGRRTGDGPRGRRALTHSSTTGGGVRCHHPAGLAPARSEREIHPQAGRGRPGACRGAGEDQAPYRAPIRNAFLGPDAPDAWASC